MWAYKHSHSPKTAASQSSNDCHYARRALVAFNLFYLDTSLKRKWPWSSGLIPFSLKNPYSDTWKFSCTESKLTSGDIDRGNNLKKIKFKNLEEMAQWSEALASLSEDPSLDPRTPITQITTTCNSSPRRSDTHFWPLWALGLTWCVHTHTQ